MVETKATFSEASPSMESLWAQRARQTPQTADIFPPSHESLGFGDWVVVEPVVCHLVSGRLLIENRENNRDILENLPVGQASRANFTALCGAGEEIPYAQKREFVARYQGSSFSGTMNSAGRCSDQETRAASRAERRLSR
jgi:hypothetical protein